MGDLTKPCELPCPKCGSTDILRQYRENGEKWDTHKHGGYSSKYANRSDGYYMTAYRDHIKHHCRTCQYAWQTTPLRKPKVARALLGDKQ